MSEEPIVLTKRPLDTAAMTIAVANGFTAGKSEALRQAIEVCQQVLDEYSMPTEEDAYARAAIATCITGLQGLR